MLKQIIGRSCADALLEHDQPDVYGVKEKRALLCAAAPSSVPRCRNVFQETVQTRRLAGCPFSTTNRPSALDFKRASTYTVLLSTDCDGWLCSSPKRLTLRSTDREDEKSRVASLS